jgi:osmotically inducible protein OsmC
MPLNSRAEVTWEGSLTEGSGTVNSASSQNLKDVPVSWASRTEAHAGRTSPEELLAAAHSSCYAMALSGSLARAGSPPERLNVSATVTFDKAGEGWGVTKSALSVRGKVPGIDAAKFKELAEAAKDGCPISRALKGNVELSVEATLE